MRIELDLPDWVENKNIYVFANFELAARKITGKEWEVKIGRCNHCGECCKHYYDRKGVLPTTKKGGCKNLEQRADGWWCKTRIPISCLVSNLNPKADYPCSVKWKTID